MSVLEWCHMSHPAYTLGAPSTGSGDDDDVVFRPYSSIFYDFFLNEGPYLSDTLHAAPVLGGRIF